MTSTTLPAPEFLLRRIEEERRLPDADECLRLRESLGLSRRDLAITVGVTVQAIRQWERNERSPRGELRRRYAEAIDVMQRASLAGDVA